MVVAASPEDRTREKLHRDENGISGNVITYRTCLQRTIKVVVYTEKRNCSARNVCK